MRITIFFLVLAGTYWQAQNIENKEAFKKCRKEFNKRKCLADEDRDGTPFYLDLCPKQFGSNQNNGCPVQAVSRKDTAKTDETDDAFLFRTLGMRQFFKGCGQIINTDSLKPAPKTK